MAFPCYMASHGNIRLDLVGQLLQSRQDIVPVVALAFVMAGIIFKFGAVPFHMWVPDVYQGAAHAHYFIYC